MAAECQILQADVLLDAIARAVEAALAEAREIENGLSHGFARDRARVDADPSDDLLAFDDADFFADFGCLDGRPLAGGAGTDHEHVIMGHESLAVPLFA